MRSSASRQEGSSKKPGHALRRSASAASATRWRRSPLSRQASCACTMKRPHMKNVHPMKTLQSREIPVMKTLHSWAPSAMKALHPCPCRRFSQYQSRKTNTSERYRRLDMKHDFQLYTLEEAKAKGLPCEQQKERLCKHCGKQLVWVGSIAKGRLRPLAVHQGLRLRGKAGGDQAPRRGGGAPSGGEGQAGRPCEVP